MKNSKLRRILLLLACAVLLVSLSVGATLAYLTSTTQTVKNTFTVGNVEITLDEAEVNEYGEVVTGADRVTANTYKLLPGRTYVKDPIVHVKAGSERCYVRVEVKVSNIEKVKQAFPADKYPTFYQGELFLLQSLVQGWDKTLWPCVSYENGTYGFWYANIMDAREAARDTAAVFSAIKVPETADNTAIKLLDGVTVDVVGYAIQADGFADAAAAWAAYSTQHP